MWNASFVIFVGRNGLHETTQKQMQKEGGFHEPTTPQDDIMCMKHSDCPKTLPLCIPGLHTTNILSKLNDRESFFIGIIFLYRYDIIS